MRSASGLAWHRRALIRVMALTPVLLVAAVSGARGESHWRTETTEPLALKGNGCGITASDLTEVPPRGPIGNVYDLRVLNLHVGQKLTDSTTGQVTATVTSVELLHMSATGADLRVAAVGSDASCSDPKLLRSGWVADPSVRVRFREILSNTNCTGASRARVYGLVTYDLGCPSGRRLALAWSHRCHHVTCRVRGYDCLRRRDGLVVCMRGRREVSWSLRPL